MNPGWVQALLWNWKTTEYMALFFISMKTNTSTTRRQGCVHRPSLINNTQSYIVIFFILSPPQIRLFSNHPFLLLPRMYNRKTFFISSEGVLIFGFCQVTPGRRKHIFAAEGASSWLHNGLRIKARRLSHKSFRITWVHIETRAVTNNYFMASGEGRC